MCLSLLSISFQYSLLFLIDRFCHKCKPRTKYISSFLAENTSIERPLMDFLRPLFYDNFRDASTEGEGRIITAESCYGNPLNLCVTLPSYTRHNYGSHNLNRFSKQIGHGYGINLKTPYTCEQDVSTSEQDGKTETLRYSYGTGCGSTSHGVCPLWVSSTFVH